MKKLFLAAVLAVAVLTTGCIQGTVKKVSVCYSVANYKCGSGIITRSVTNNAACGEKGNLLLGIIFDDNGYPIIGNQNAINSDSAGIWIQLMAGTLVDPKASCGIFKADTACFGVVRVCGKGTYDSENKAFIGDGKFITMISGAAEICGTGKLYGKLDDNEDMKSNFEDGKACYKGVMNIKITPGFAYLVEVEDGKIVSQVPVTASISLPCIPICTMAGPV